MVVLETEFKIILTEKIPGLEQMMRSFYKAYTGVQWTCFLPLTPDYSLDE